MCGGAAQRRRRSVPMTTGRRPPRRPCPRPQGAGAQYPARKKGTRHRTQSASSLAHTPVHATRQVAQSRRAGVPPRWATHNKEVVHLCACDGGGNVAALQSAPLVLLRMYPRPQRQLVGTKHRKGHRTHVSRTAFPHALLATPPQATLPQAVGGADAWRVGLVLGRDT